MQIAASNNPGVLQKFNEYQAALQKVPQVGALPDPEFSIGVFITPMELVDGRELSDMRLMQMFPWFGTLKAAKDEMSLMANAKYQEFENQKLQVFYDIQTTWYELLKNQEEIHINLANLDILEMIERIAVSNYKAAPIGAGTSENLNNYGRNNAASPSAQNSPGMQSMGSNSGSGAGQGIAPSPSPMPTEQMGTQGSSSGLAGLYRIQIEILDLKNADSTLYNQKRSLAARFNSMLNRPAETPVALADTLIPIISEYTLPGPTDSLFTKNPMLLMLDYEKQSLEARKEMVSRMGYPMFGIGLDYTLVQKSAMSNSSMNGQDMFMPMLTVTLPIYRQKYKAMINEADLMMTSTEQGYSSAYNALQADYYQVYQAMQDAGRRIRLYDTQQSLAQKTLDITLKSFSVNGSGLTEILLAEQQILDYSFKRAEAIAEYNTAVAGLKKILAIMN